MTDNAKRNNEGSHYEPGMIIVEGDLVVAYGRYSGAGTTFSAAVIFRFEGDFLVEHWDVLQQEVPSEKTVTHNANVYETVIEPSVSS